LHNKNNREVPHTNIVLCLGKNFSSFTLESKYSDMTDASLLEMIRITADKLKMEAK